MAGGRGLCVRTRQLTRVMCKVFTRPRRTTFINHLRNVIGYSFTYRALLDYKPVEVILITHQSPINAHWVDMWWYKCRTGGSSCVRALSVCRWPQSKHHRQGSLIYLPG